MIIVTYPFTPAEDYQAQDRLRRRRRIETIDDFVTACRDENLTFVPNADGELRDFNGACPICSLAHAMFGGYTPNQYVLTAPVCELMAIGLASKIVNAADRPQTPYSELREKLESL